MASLHPPENDVIQDALKVILQGIIAQNPHEHSLSFLEETNPTSNVLETNRIDSYLQLLHLAATSFQNEVTSQILKLKHRRNALANIHKLPVEMIISIFKRLVTPPRNGTHTEITPLPQSFFETPHQLSDVSEGWGRIVRGAPELWSVIDSRQDEAQWSECFELSKSHPLTLHIEPDNELFWIVASNNLHRWRSVYIDGLRNGQLRALEPWSAPALENLTITGNQTNYDPVLLDLFKGGRPAKLRSFKSGLRVTLRHWKAPFLLGLRELHLHTSSIYAPSLRDVLDILEASPQLELLRLRHVRFWPEDAIPVLSTPISLPSLRYAEVDKFPISAIQMLLQNIEAPDCTYWCLSCAEPGSVRRPEEREQLFRAMTCTVAPSFKASLVTGRKVNIRQDGTCINLTITPHDTACPSFTLRLDMYTPVSNTVAWLRDAASYGRSSLPSPIDTEITIAGNLTTTATDSAILSAARLPYLRTTKITFQDFRGYLDDAIRSLMKPEKGGNRLCPALETISFQNCKRLDAGRLLQFVEDRVQAVRASHQLEGVQQVSRLRKVEVDEKLFGFKTRQAILDLLGNQ